MDSAETSTDKSVHQVHAGEDHLGSFVRKSSLDAVSELVWNCLDAEATQVDIVIEKAALVDGGAQHVTRIEIVDNGLGIDARRALAAFPSLGDSWKKALNGRTESGRRVLHGQRGRGRFYAYSLGHSVTWSTIYSDSEDTHFGYQISGNSHKINRFRIADPVETSLPTGTTVKISVQQGKDHISLLRDSFRTRLGARFAPHLLGNTDIVITFDDAKLDPAELIAAQPADIILDTIKEDDLKGFDRPVLRIIEWEEGIGHDHPRLSLCSGAGATLIELPGQQREVIKATGYLMWDGFGDPTTDLLLAEAENPRILAAAEDALNEYISDRISDIELEIVAELKSEGSYPDKYALPTVEPLDVAERDLYNHLLVVARSSLGNTKRSRTLSAELLRMAVEERPESLDAVLTQALALPPETVEELADLLSRSPLSEIVQAANVVTRRIDLLVAMKSLLYDSDESKQLREVDQLHPLVAHNEWLFGEDWKLARSEASLTSVLRAAVPNTTLLESELVDSNGQLRRSDGRAGRVDLLLQRHFTSPTGNVERLVVELKRPSKKLDQSDVEQVKSYARALTRHQGLTQGKWQFWLVGSTFTDDLMDDAKQTDRSWGHVVKKDEYDVFVVQWSRLLDGAQQRLSVFRDELSYDVSQLEAVDLLKRRYGFLGDSQQGGSPAEAHA